MGKKNNYKKALITGITGQDGSYLAEFLLSKNYEVHGIKRRSSSFNTKRLDDIYQDHFQKNKKFFLHFGDLTDSLSLAHLINKIKPDEIYNLAAQSHVGVSFNIPEYTANVNALGTLRLLEVIKQLSKVKKIKFYQASTSELYGATKIIPQNEKTTFYPRSPYATSKLFAHWITVNYREAFNIFACNGILFNHESPRRGETFVTKKIIKGFCDIVNGLENNIVVGNLYSLRDWGYAEEYAKMQWLILQQKKPTDFVISTGKQYTVKEFIEKTSKYLGIQLVWSGNGLNEIAKIKKLNLKKSNNLKIGQIIVKIDKRYFRPAEVENLLGDSRKAKRILGWKPKVDINLLIKLMIENELKSQRYK
jgi:GDPmannose 4,6-dehydratase